MSETVTITRIGHRGDGIAQTANGPVYVPFTLPGEAVRIVRSGTRGQLENIITPSPQRVEPPCRHFGTCGGCALQMMSGFSLVPVAKTVVFATYDGDANGKGDGNRRYVFSLA